MGIYTRYEPVPTEKVPTGDAAWIKEDWLEETHRRFDPETRREILAGNPFAFLDQDGDGYVEVSQVFWEKFSAKFPDRQFPLATYFAEPQECNKEKAEQEKRIRRLPQLLRRATRNHNFRRVRSFFTKEASQLDNPLKALQPLLSKHLEATALHMGGNVDESVQLRDRSGFSVRHDGRLRFDCVLFAELARSDFRDIFGIKATYVLLDASPPNSIDHVIVILNDELHKGRFILVSNDSATYIESDNIWAEVKKRFPDYSGYYRAGTVTALDEMKRPF
ncbi:MAG: hypothetical protein HY542_05390 [Deltaproteobacteria bacterium]|nr:hypothetical protein [Deltaproteobacteria bacterium]